MNIPYAFKRCTKCGEWLIANNVNFKKAKGGKYKLYSKCKICEKKYRLENEGYMQEYYQNNKDEIQARHKQYYNKNKEYLLECNSKYREENKEYLAECNKQWRQKNEERIVKYRKQYYQENKNEILNKNKLYYQENKDEILKRNRQWNEENKEKLTEYKKQYYQENKEYLKAYMEQYNEVNKEKILERKRIYYQKNKERLRQYDKERDKNPERIIAKFNYTCKRRIREQNQGSGITAKQWSEMMEFFNWKCAYSGISLTKENRSVDHIVPLFKKGEHEVWNCVPSYDIYNFQKQDKLLLEWYKQQDFYSEERLQKIYEWQKYAYNKWSCKTIDVKEA